MNIRFLKRIASFLILCAICSTLFAPGLLAQSISVSGVVKDETGEPVIGATVMVTGQPSNGTVTNLNGEFRLSGVPRDGSVTISFIGLKTEVVPVNGNQVLHVILHEDNELLDEVVVVAYGVQKKSTLTGALASVDTKELIKVPVSSVTNVLAGALPGISTVQTSGQPGADVANIFIRGAGSLNNAMSRPLILVDGVEREFSQIDPNEIATLSILKDASSTAVFGVRGANGVILITTRRGVEGRPSVSVTTTSGIQQPISYVKQTGSYEYARFWNLKQQADGVQDRGQYFTREAIEQYRIGSDPIMYSSTDWTDYIFKKAFFQTRNNVNISGGNDHIKYFVSLGYLFQDGILKKLPTLPYDNNFSYHRYNYRANLDYKLTPSTSIRLNVGGNVGRRQAPKVVEGIPNIWVYTTIWTVPMSGPGLIDGVRTIVAPNFYPGEVVRDGFGGFYGFGYDQRYNTTLNMDVQITQDLSRITKGLSFSVKGAYDNIFRLNKSRGGGGIEYQTAYYQSFLTDKTKPQTDPDYDKTIVFVPSGKNTPLTYGESYGRDRNWYLESRLNYDRAFGDHALTALLLYNQSRDYYPGQYTYIPRSYLGLVGRVTYGYANKYLAEINAGYNGSENFAPGRTRYGFFPSFSAGWVVTGEEFMKSQKFFDFLKLRISWGRVGSDLGSSTRFMYRPSVWQPSGNYSFGIDNPNTLQAFGVGVPGNPGVTWETADKQNYGIDINALDYRLSLTADLFWEKRSGILISPRSTPNIIATRLPNLNIGEVHNRGYEVAIGWKDGTDNGDFSYSIGANVTYARNKIINMDEVPNPYPYMNLTGGPTGRQPALYDFVRLYQYSDFDQDENGKLTLKKDLPQPMVEVFPGDAMYADKNGDGVVDGYDKMAYGFSERPEYVFGINGGIHYKGLDINMQWTGATNVAKMMEVEFRIPFTNAGKRGLLQYFYDDCWTEENQSGTLPRAAEKSEAWNSEPSTLWLKDASYLRLKTLSVGYTFKDYPLLDSMGVKELGLSLSGYNILTFSPLKTMDPESLTTNNGGYPIVKTYNLGLKINF